MAEFLIKAVDAVKSLGQDRDVKVLGYDQAAGGCG